MLIRAKLARALLLALALPVIAAAADTWPAHPIKLIVPFAPGGSSDIAARVFSQKLSERLGQQVIVENRSSAGGVLGAELLAHSPPDGYTLGLANASSETASPIIFSNVTYHPVSDFTYIAFIGTVPAVLIVKPSFPARSVADLIQMAKVQPGKIDFGTAGNGTIGHIVGEMFQLMTGTKLTHVPYRGSGFMFAGLQGTDIPVAFDVLAQNQEHIKSGRVRPLAISGSKRVVMAPDIPTFVELGYPDLIGENWLGLAAPAGLPRAIVERLHNEMTQIAKDPEIADRLIKLGITYQSMSSVEFQDYVAKQYVRWGRIVKAAGITVN